ncbi:glucan endo-1,3-beta-glucosidase 13-like [Argentina anserina]|uniref:glucan endo-1,3-beta-glucosidase 13-like n=1 Tax=Argentina anserina TaxID=57926 RepID=UPI0021763532|nr:glucan endo-1,3-beta-glucosidase 13-like [Potentilla anserina]
MTSFKLPVLASLLLSIFSIAFAAEKGSIGINYGRIANDLPAPTKVVELLKSQGITNVKLFDTDAAVLTALADSNISVVVCLPNELLSSVANDQSFADKWVQANISHYHPKTKIEAIAVGNEVFADKNNTTDFLVPAIKNIYTSLNKYNLDSSIKLSTPIALSALQNSYPPSAGSFKPDLVQPVIKPLLDFLQQTRSYLMVNAYPFFAYAANSDQISLDYALFKQNAGNVDSGNGLRYMSLFEAQLDAVSAAMSAIGTKDMKMVVTETGWPSNGDENEIGAGKENAAAYNGNLVRRVLTGGGTPLKPQDPLNVYLFALFNENQKPGPTSERNYGLFYPDEKKVYDIPLAAAELSNDQATAANESKAQVKPSGNTWCVANEKAGEEKLQAALDYACGEGGADCRPITDGSTCFNPNTLEAHASYAFNSYYQKKARGTGTCNFGGAAYVVAQPPSYGTCEFPTGY